MVSHQSNDFRVGHRAVSDFFSILCAKAEEKKLLFSILNYCIPVPLFTEHFENETN
jgi:hypothetical protein